MRTKKQKQKNIRFLLPTGMQVLGLDEEQYESVYQTSLPSSLVKRGESKKLEMLCVTIIGCKKLILHN